MRLFLLLTLVFTNSALAQIERPAGAPSREEEPGFVFFQAVNLPSDEPGLSRIDVHFRILHDFFIALKNNDPMFPWPFKRRAELLIELFDSSGISRARDIKRFELGAATPEPSPDRSQWYESYSSFEVTPGRYTVSFEADDLESERRFNNRDRRITALSFRADTMQASTLFFTSPPVDDSTTFRFSPQNFGGNIRFGGKGGMYVGFSSPNNFFTPGIVEYRFTTVAGRFQETEVLFADTVRDLQVMKEGILVPAKGVEGIAYEHDVAASQNYTGVYVPLPLEHLPLRTIELHLRIRGGETVREFLERFNVIWPEMPRSLRDVDLALDVLRYITRPGQLDSLKRGNFERKRANLESFWKEKDPTPETALNEVMAEYYRRVDHATRAFGTIREPDGWKSDRGRIHILHGNPSRIERILSPDAGFQEIWIYETLHRKFVFADPSRNGTYVLVSTQAL